MDRLYKNAKTEDLIAVFNLFEKKGTGSKSNTVAKDMFAAIREELKIRGFAKLGVTDES